MTIGAAFPRSSYAPSLSGLRGIALLMVVVGHLVQRLDRFVPDALGQDGLGAFVTRALMAPAVGVYLFFAISGLLIARSLEGGRLTLGQFYLRRTLRIVPPYAVLLLATWLVLTGFGWEPPQTKLFRTGPESLAASLLASLTFTHGVLFGSYPRLFPPGWTLEVEMQFYLVAPMLDRLGRWLEAQVTALVAAALAFGAAGLCTVATIRSGIGQLQPTLLVYLPVFLVGMAAQRLWRRGWRPAPRLASFLGWGALAVFMLVQPWVTAPGAEVTVRAALIALMLVGLASRHGSFGRVCASAPLAKLGAAAYSVYLVNLQVMHVAAAWAAHAGAGLPPLAQATLVTVVGGLLVAFCSILFYALVEKPALAFSDWAIRRSLASGGSYARPGEGRSAS